MSAALLLKLLDGQYICPVAHRPEYEELQDLEAQQATDAWLRRIDKRLARLGEDGAFFMSPVELQQTDASRIREEFLRLRDVYAPAILMLNTIRQAKPDSFAVAAGDYVQLADLEQSVNDNSTLETQLRGMIGLISGVGVRNNNREVLKKMLEHLRADGYLVLWSEQTGTYRVTGKIDQLHAVIEFVHEHGLVNEPALDQPGDDQADLLTEPGDE